MATMEAYEIYEDANGDEQPRYLDDPKILHDWGGMTDKIEIDNDAKRAPYEGRSVGEAHVRWELRLYAGVPGDPPPTGTGEPDGGNPLVPARYHMNGNIEQEPVEEKDKDKPSPSQEGVQS